MSRRATRSYRAFRETALAAGLVVGGLGWAGTSSTLAQDAVPQVSDQIAEQAASHSSGSRGKVTAHDDGATVVGTVGTSDAVSGSSDETTGPAVEERPVVSEHGVEAAEGSARTGTKGAADEQRDDASGSSTVGVTTAASNAVATPEDEQAPALDTSEVGASKPEAEPIPEPPKELRIATWSGAYRDAQKLAVFDPFAEHTGIAVRTLEHSGGGKLLRSDATDVNWDIADVPYHIAKAGCRAGALATIDTSKVTDPSGERLDASDFLPETIGDCAIGGTVWSAVIGYDTSQFEGETPTRLEDFFDTDRFAGKRGILRSPRYIMEMALLADGAAPGAVYRLLATDVGVQRALGKLEQIRGDIVWMKSAREPVTALKERKVAMAIGFSGRFFLETAGRDSRVSLMWDGQIYDLDVWVIPKGTTHMQTALKFLSFAIQSDVMTHQASILPYGPARRSAARKVSRHASLNIDLSNFVPTAPQNFQRALQIDEAWWQKHEERLVAALRTWIDGNADSPGE